VGQGVPHHVGHDPLQKRGVGQHSGQVLGDVDHGSRRLPGQAHEGGRYDLLEAHGAQDEPEGTGLEAAHVEQIADEGVEAIDLLVDGHEQLMGIVLTEVDVGLEEAGGRRLNRRERSSEVMTDRSEQRGAQLVRLAQGGGMSGFGLQAPFAQRLCHPSGEGVEHAAVVPGQRASCERQGAPAVEGENCVSMVRIERHRAAAAGLDAPAGSFGSKDGRGLQVEGGPQRLDQGGQWVVPVGEGTGYAGQRMRLGLRPHCPSLRPRRLIDQQRHDQGNSQKDGNG